MSPFSSIADSTKQNTNFPSALGRRVTLSCSYLMKSVRSKSTAEPTAPCPSGQKFCPKCKEGGHKRRRSNEFLLLIAHITSKLWAEEKRETVISSLPFSNRKIKPNIPRNMRSYVRVSPFSDASHRQRVEILYLFVNDPTSCSF